jgi:excisionase family DNA binding protein
MPRRALTPEEQATALLTSSQAGRLIGVNGQTVVKWAKQGGLPYSTTLGGHMRFRRSDIEDYIRRMDGPADAGAGRGKVALAGQ